MPGDATWNDRHFGSAPWASPGALIGVDYVEAASATTAVVDLGGYVWSSGGLVDDVKAWQENPGSNFGFILASDDETTLGSGRRFGSTGTVGWSGHAAATDGDLYAGAGAGGGGLMPGGTGSAGFAAGALRLVADDVVPRSHPAVGAGGVDFHQVLAELMEKVGSAPTVDEFAVFVERLAFGRAELGTLGISAHDGLHDLGIGADRVLAGEGAVVAEHQGNLVEIGGDLRIGIHSLVRRRRARSARRGRADSQDRAGWRRGIPRTAAWARRDRDRAGGGGGEPESGWRAGDRWFERAGGLDFRSRLWSGALVSTRREIQFPTTTSAMTTRMLDFHDFMLEEAEIRRGEASEIREDGVDAIRSRRRTIWRWWRRIDRRRWWESSVRCWCRPGR